MPKGIAIGDLHLPWVKKSALEKVYHAIEREQPAYIVQLGDLYERFSQNRFAKTAGLITPAVEADRGRSAAERFWAKVRQIAPNAKLFQLRGNHDERVLKVLLEKAPELEPFVDDKDFYRFPGVETVFNPKEPLIINGVVFIHGWGALGYHMRYFLRPVIRAHSHTAGLVFMNLYGKTIYEMDVGFLANTQSTPLRYRPTTVTKWTHAYGLIDDFGPRVCLL